MEGRHARPQIAAVSLEGGWNPAHLLMALALGLILGVGLGLKDEILGTGVDRDERYLVLASAFYGQDPIPTMAASLRQRLVHLGFANPSLIVLKLADRFAASRDRQRQLEAEGLRIFGEALNVAVESPAVARSTPTVAPHAAGAPAAASVVVPVATPATAEPQPSPTATSQPSVSPALASVATATATAPAPQGTPGTIRSESKVPVRLRREASTQSGVVAIIPFGAKVQVLQVVKGKADDPGIDSKELRWYQVRWGSYSGYVYYKLVAVGE